jgi:hypothetical protein
MPAPLTSVSPPSVTRSARAWWAPSRTRSGPATSRP